VVLYELLVGALPLDLSKVPFDQIPRALREQDAPRPSTKLRTLGERSGVTAQNRGADAPTLVRQVRGDLDAITLKALEKDRARRYATPVELAADIGRCLRNEPVGARPASAGYLARKYLRRHRIGVSVAAAVTVLLISFATAQAVQLQRITREGDRETRERDRADRITDFMTGMFDLSDPDVARGNSVTAREILDKASKEIDPGLSRDPELQGQMMYIMGRVYDNLGLFPQARSLFMRAVDIQRRVLGPQNADTAKSMGFLAWALHDEGRYAEAEKLEREALDTQRHVLGSDDPNALTSLLREADILDHLGRYVEAEKLDREGLIITRRVLGPEHQETLLAMMFLAWSLYHQGKYAEGEKLMRQTLDIQRRVLGPERESTRVSMTRLADILNKEGRYAEAEKLARETREIDRRIYGPGSESEALSTYILGVAALGQGKPDEALLHLRDAVDHGLNPSGSIGTPSLLGIEADPDLKALHGNPRFAALVAHAKERAAEAQKPH